MLKTELQKQLRLSSNNAPYLADKTTVYHDTLVLNRTGYYGNFVIG